MPLPSEDTTPPVMKMNRVMSKPGGPDALPKGSHHPANEVECLVHRDGIAKYQKYLGATSPGSHGRLLAPFRCTHRRMLRPLHAPARLIGGCDVDGRADP